MKEKTPFMKHVPCRTETAIAYSAPSLATAGLFVHDCHTIGLIPLSHRMRWQHGALRQRPPQPAANVRVGNAEHRVGTAAIRRPPQSVLKKLNMFNFCRRFLRWILRRDDTVVLPPTPCLHR